LVHQSGLHLDQAVLIAGQRFEFGYLLAIGVSRCRSAKSARPVLASR
jgi:hypothetical protein